MTNFNLSERQKLGLQDLKDVHRQMLNIRSNTSDVHLDRAPEGGFIWEIPAALILVSVGFWENFLNKDIELFGY